MNESNMDSYVIFSSYATCSSYALCATVTPLAAVTPIAAVAPLAAVTQLATVTPLSGSEKGAFYVATGIVQSHDVSILYSVIVTSSHNIIMKDTSRSNILL